MTQNISGRNHFENVSPRYFVEFPPDAPDYDEVSRGSQLIEMLGTPIAPEAEAPLLIDHLADTGQGISLAMQTLDDTTATFVRLLNQKNIPVVAWVILPDQLGYWTNKTNTAQTMLRTDEIMRWADRNGIQFTALGFDSEKPLEWLRAVNTGNTHAFIKQLKAYHQAKRRHLTQFGDPELLMNEFFKGLRESGIQTEAYVMPRIAQLLLGGMNIPADRQIEMLYSSPLPAIFRPLATHLLRNRRSIPALGIVSGVDGETPGRDLTNGVLPNHLTQQDLTRDLRDVMRQGIKAPDGSQTTLGEFYLFAMNSARVANILSTSMAEVNWLLNR